MIRFTLNGQAVETAIDVDTPLLWVVRDHFKLKGSKFGCGAGLCGACTMHVDGAAVKTCVTPISAVAGRAVTTIEGLGTPDAPSPMQRAFLENDGYQCGYCTPGQICSATAMLGEIANGWPSDASETLDGPIEATGDEIRERMSGNLCRCGAYANIVAAIRGVAAEEGA